MSVVKPTVEPLHHLVGARLGGYDLSEPMDPTNLKIIREYLAQYQVLVFPEQSLDRKMFYRFAMAFGASEVFKHPGFVIPPDPDEGGIVQRLTNLDEQGVPLGDCAQTRRMGITENWHTDSSYRTVPAFLTLLYGVEIPTEGGDTHFASMHAAYDALPPDLREKVEPLGAVHSWEFQRKLVPDAAPITEEERQLNPPVIHPLVQHHRETSRKLLYTSSSAERIVGLPYDEGRAILDEIMRISTRPEAIYAHKWSVGDVVIWDNRATFHRVGAFDYQSLTLRRLLHRMVVAGDPADYTDRTILPQIAA